MPKVRRERGRKHSFKNGSQEDFSSRKKKKGGQRDKGNLFFYANKGERGLLKGGEFKHFRRRERGGSSITPGMARIFKRGKREKEFCAVRRKKPTICRKKRGKEAPRKEISEKETVCARTTDSMRLVVR